MTVGSSASTDTSSLIERTIAGPLPVRTGGSGSAHVDGSVILDGVRTERTEMATVGGSAVSATTTVTGSSWAVFDGGGDEFTHHRQFHVATDSCAVDDVSCGPAHDPSRVTDRNGLAGERALHHSWH